MANHIHCTPGIFIGVLEGWLYSLVLEDSGLLPPADELIAMYEQAHGAKLPDLNWFRALAAYKFAIISGFNLGLHRRGKRHDPHWELLGPSMTSLIERTRKLLD